MWIGMESPSFDDRSAALAVAHGMVSLLRAFAAADEGDFQPLHLWSTVNGVPEPAGSQLTGAISLVNHLVVELSEATGRSHPDILESLQNTLADEDNWA